MKTMFFLSIILVILSACDKQGPMGNEGPQGPDGPPGSGGGGAGNVVAVTYTPPTRLQWTYADGWGEYDVFWPDNGGNYLTLPDSLIDAINTGLVLVYLRDVEGEWRRLPFETGLPYQQGHQVFDYYFDQNHLYLAAKALKHQPTQESWPLIAPDFKVVVAPPSRLADLTRVE